MNYVDDAGRALAQWMFDAPLRFNNKIVRTYSISKFGEITQHPRLSRISDGQFVFSTQWSFLIVCSNKCGWLIPSFHRNLPVDFWRKLFSGVDLDSLTLFDGKF
jgi:hypothetical protein